MTEPSTTEQRTPPNPMGNGGRIETLTRNTAQGSIVEVLDAIRQRQRFLLTSHARPDGDAVGSLLALWMTLNAMGKQAEMQLFDPVPVIYGTLPAADQIRQFAGPMVGFEPDAVIFLECDSVGRSRLEGLDNKFLINIDHHTSGTSIRQRELD